MPFVASYGMLTEIQSVILTCLLGPEDPRAFKNFQSRHYRNDWLNKRPEGRAAYAANKNSKYNLKHPDRRERADVKWRNQPENAAHMWAHRMMKLYGLSAEQWRGFMEKQNGCCGLCGKEFIKTPHVDHDHSTGFVRGLLCYNCNAGLGYFKDSSELLERAKEYLSRALENFKKGNTNAC